MKWPTNHHVLVAAVLVGVCAVGLSQAGELQAWGLDGDGQVSRVPAGGDYVAIAAGDAHGLALRSDGIVVAWGRNDDGQCDVPVGSYRAIGAGADFSLAVRSDGAIAAWGYDGAGQVSDVPEGTNFVTVDGGEFFAVALRSDGSIAAWGNDRWGQVSGVPAGTDFVSVVAGDDHAVALRSDGTLVTWGYWAAVDGTPTTGRFTAIAAGGTFSVALRDDGSIVWWGEDSHGYGLDVVPRGEDFVSVAAGYLHALALKRDGTVVAWGAGTDASGHPNWGQAMPPDGNDFEALSGGLYFSLSLAAESEDNEPNDATKASDDFNDDHLADFWTISGEDLTSCMLVEQNQRLELITTSKSRGTSTYCVGTGWQLDPVGDFSFKVNYHYSPVTDEAGWIFFGIVPDANDPDGRYVKVGVGCDAQSAYTWYEVSAAEQSQLRSSARRQDNGVLYVSYDAVLDKLYLSESGYGSANAAMTVTGVLGASWGGAPLSVFFGGGANTLELGSGEAWFDNFVVDTGTLYAEPVVETFSDVYRFWSPSLALHFYTIDPAERDAVIQNYPDVWTYEGPVFKAATSAFESGLLPVYRFWSAKSGHFYTIDEAEKEELIIRGADIWAYEGIAFYAYPEGAQPADAKPVYRFVMPSNGSYFYTIEEADRDWLIRELSDVYTYEGVVYFAYPI
jgi:hypothetical protein